MGDNANWDWCNKDKGGSCKGIVPTTICTSGTASLKNTHGNPYDTSSNVSFTYPLNGCNYAYYATYECTGIALKQTKFKTN